MKFSPLLADVLTVKSLLWCCSNWINGLRYGHVVVECCWQCMPRLESDFKEYSYYHIVTSILVIGCKTNNRFQLLITDVWIMFVSIMFVSRWSLHHRLVTAHEMTDVYNKATACVPACHCTHVVGRRQWPASRTSVNWTFKFLTQWNRPMQVFKIKCYTHTLYSSGYACHPFDKQCRVVINI